MNLLKSMRRAQRVLTPALLVASAALCRNALATVPGEYDLSPIGNTTVSVPGAVGGTAIFSDFFTQPAGTGVFEPFLTIEANAAGKPPTSNSNIEQGYNTDGQNPPNNLYMDQQRPQWNNLLRLSDLATLTISGTTYYGFELDANEPSGGKNLISIDNIRIYTGADHTGSVQNDISALGGLGTLRWAMNEGVKNADGTWKVSTWVKLDSEQENVEAGNNASNGGSGKSDMIVYVPTSAFDGALSTDYVWFWNLNGVHYNADLPDGTDPLAAEAGYEEWRAVTGPQRQVPDGGMTIALLGAGLLGLGAMRRKLS